MSKARLGMAASGLLVGLWLFVGCGETIAPPPPDPGSGQPQQPTEPAPLGTETTQPATDPAPPAQQPQQVDPPASDPASSDPASSDPASSDPADAAPQLPPPPNGDLGPVMCRTDDDCGHGLTCIKRIPGGHCKGCNDTITCPAGLKCFQGVCVRPCTKDADCNYGMRCLGTSHCAGRGCLQGCPSMYPCEYPLCERPRCDAGQACPPELLCDGEFCMEPL